MIYNEVKILQQLAADRNTFTVTIPGFMVIKKMSEIQSAKA